MTNNLYQYLAKASQPRKDTSDDCDIDGMPLLSTLFVVVTAPCWLSCLCCSLVPLHVSLELISLSQHSSVAVRLPSLRLGKLVANFNETSGLTYFAHNSSLKSWSLIF